MEIATIGFTKSSAESFFGRIAASGLRRLGDVRLNNTSQLAGFAKRHDLAYFLDRVCQVEYVELPILAPEEEMLRSYRSGALSWADYELRYLELLHKRDAAVVVDQSLFEPGIVLLCSEDKPDHCHRRLAAEYLQSVWGDITIRHL